MQGKNIIELKIWRHFRQIPCTYLNQWDCAFIDMKKKYIFIPRYWIRISNKLTPIPMRDLKLQGEHVDKTCIWDWSDRFPLMFTAADIKWRRVPSRFHANTCSFSPPHHEGDRPLRSCEKWSDMRRSTRCHRSNTCSPSEYPNTLESFKHLCLVLSIYFWTSSVVI